MHQTRRRVAEEGEAAGVAVYLKGQQPLVAGGDVLLGGHLDLRRRLPGADQVVQDEDVGVGGGGGLLKAAAGHPQEPLQAVYQLRRRAGVDFDLHTGGAGDSLIGDGESGITSIWSGCSATESMRLIASRWLAPSTTSTSRPNSARPSSGAPPTKKVGRSNRNSKTPLSSVVPFHRAQRQCADMHRLTGLVDGLVRRDEEFVFPDNLDGPFHEVLPGLGVGLHDEPGLALHIGGDGELHIGGAVGVGGSLEEGEGFPVGPAQADGDVGAGDGFAVGGGADQDAQGGPAAGGPFLLPQDDGLLAVYLPGQGGGPIGGGAEDKDEQGQRDGEEGAQAQSEVPSSGAALRLPAQTLADALIRRNGHADRVQGRMEGQAQSRAEVGPRPARGDGPAHGRGPQPQGCPRRGGEMVNVPGGLLSHPNRRRGAVGGAGGRGSG